MAIPTQTPPMPWEGQAIPEHLNLRCTQCGYSLTGLKNRICPECGKPFDPLATYQQNIKSTWEFHFSYQRPLWQYVALGVSLLPAWLLYVIAGWMSGGKVFISPFWYGACVVSTAPVLVCGLLYDWHSPVRWIVIFYLCGILAFLMSL